MSLDLNVLRQAVAANGAVARVLVLDSAGSVPRDAGTAMLVWDDGQHGTIGGGALELEALRAAREALNTGQDKILRQPLGPSLAQCCGGTVTLLTEIWDDQRCAGISDDVVARPLPGTNGGVQSLGVTRVLSQLRGGQSRISPQTLDGWVIETVTKPRRSVWIFGAGHVGRAFVNVLSPMPDFEITWVDTALDRFPDKISESVRVIPAANPADCVHLAPNDAEHFVMTFSHVLDLELCHQLLRHGFAFAGLIGSNTKWVRFRKRLKQLGHLDAQIDRITCPIGDPNLGKHPQAIAVGVVSGLLSQHLPKNATKASGD
jgi:xanthine dehydrogenase accessory factor